MDTKAILAHVSERPYRFRETNHVSVASGNSIASHGPEQSVKSRGLLAEKVPSRVVCGGSLRHLTVRAGLDSVDQIGELDGRLDEEDGDIVAHNIEIALVGVATSKLVCGSLDPERLGLLTI